MLKTFLAAVLLTSSLVGCAGTAYVTASDPPPPREEVVTVRPGYVFVHGHWDRDHGSWRWREGHYERERANQRWVDGRWQRNGNQHVWVEGHWTTSGGVSVR